MQSDFLLDDNPKPGANKNANNNNIYKVSDRQSRKKKSSHYRSNQTPRLDSVNGLSIISDNLPGSSMSVADITLTMSNEEGQNVVCLEQSTSRLDSGVEEDFPASALFPPSPRQIPSSSQDSSCHIPQCTNPLCESDTCPWHKYILKSPQHVRWMRNTFTIELKRSPHTKSFGFNTKAKEHCLSDKKNKEIYILVKKVEAGSSAALAGLAVGDLVHSVNYVALHSSQQYNTFVNTTLKNAAKLMMQVQRPNSILVKDKAMLAEFAMVQKTPVPLAKPLSPSTSPDVKFPPCSPSSDAIPLRPVVRSKVKSHIPQARLIVCGNRTNEFMRCFMGGFIQFPVESHASYHQVSLECRQSGSSISVSNSISFSCMVRESSQNSVNVDIISVASDNFFHHCCPWIFSPDSIFVLTFDVKRLAQFSDAEMARLSSLKHTVQSSRSGSNGRLKLVGVVLPGEDVSLEEIRTLFYTSLGETLPGPDFVPISGTARTKEMQQFQVEIFQSVREISSKSQVVLPALNAMDCLISHQNLTITNQELSSALMNYEDNFGSDAELLTNIINDLKSTGNLLSTSHLSQSGSTQELIIPSKLFDCLVQITMASDKIQVPSSGIITRSNLVGFLEAVTFDPIKLLTCLEDFGVVYAVEVKGRDSGFCEEIGVIFPFLLEEVPFDVPADGYHELLTIQLSEPLASTIYLSWLSKLSNHCQRFEVMGQTASRFLMEGLDVTCVWSRPHNHIRLLVKRGTTSSQTSQLQRFENSLHTSLAVLRSSFQIHWSEERSQRNSLEASVDNMGNNGEHYLAGVNLLEYETIDFLPLLHGNDQGGNDLNMLQLLLNCAIVTIPHLTVPLQRMHQHLSVNNSWEELASYLGQTTKQIAVFATLVPANPNRLPAETFYINFTNETHCTLGDILSGLLQMSDNNPQWQRLASNLIGAALTGYKRHRRNNP